MLAGKCMALGFLEYLITSRVELDRFFISVHHATLGIFDPAGLWPRGRNQFVIACLQGINRIDALPKK